MIEHGALRPVGDDATERARRELHAQMLDGWAMRQRASGDKDPSIQQQVRRVERLVEFTGGRFAWEWASLDVDRWGASIASTKRKNTTTGYQGAVRAFLKYVIDPAYDWSDKCFELFGTRPRQLCVPENTSVHTWIYEGDPGRRAFTDDELRCFFSMLRERMAAAVAHGRKGLLIAARDYAMFAVALGYGLRAREDAKLDLADHSEAADPIVKRAYGSYGVITVRFGKAKRGGEARRRQVLTVPLFEWAAQTLRWYVEEIRPHLHAEPGHENALWLTERGTMPTAGYVSGRFTILRRAAGLPECQKMHCLRHTYITRMLEDNYAELFVRQQVQHEDAATTGIYTSVSDDFKRRVVTDAIRRVVAG